VVYYDLTLIITKPDGTTVNQFFNNSDVGAAVNGAVVCDQLGTWSVKLNWPGDENHEGCISPPYNWTVQQAAIDRNPPNVPTPTGYWTFPISAQNYNWFWLSGPWAQNRYDATQSHFNPYSKGPNTPHILWRNQVVPGGLIGGEQGWYSIQGTFSSTVENNVGLTNYVAANGRLYFATRDFKNNVTATEILLHCVDQYTGEEIYAVDLDRPLAAPSLSPSAFPPGRPTLIFEAIGQVKGGTLSRTATVTGGYSLWVSGNGLREIDPMTGNTIYYRTDVSPSVYADGHFYYATGGNLTSWNTRSKTVEWVKPGYPSPTYVWNDILVYANKGSNGIIRTTTFNATTGDMIANGTLSLYSVTLAQCVADGKIFYSGYDLRIHAVDLYTCQEAWVSEPMTYPFGSQQAYGASSAYGIVYTGMCDGYIYAWNTTNGQLVWKFFSGNTTNTGYGTYPFWGNIVIAEGKLYVATGEHTPPNPMPYGYSLYCIDAYTGEEIWNYPSFTSYTFASVAFGQGISAGMLFYQNNMDGCLYMFGQGQSKTTVTATDNAVLKGTAVLIQGTVMDQSPGSKDMPAISDDDQSAWMQHLYNNAPKPTNATGVPVEIFITDPNGNTQSIGWATSDICGTFAKAWTPPVEGLYKVTANFPGTLSYYDSAATAYFVVSSMPTQSATPFVPPTQTIAPSATSISTPEPSATQPAEPPSSPSPMVEYIAIAAAVIIVVLVASAIVLRKRK
jgi:outer membrane protein assembly factor BamB